MSPFIALRRIAVAIKEIVIINLAILRISTKLGAIYQKQLNRELLYLPHEYLN